jgi:predicted TPR repeat methyltransferase
MDLQKNADRFTGKEYLQLYDRYRPEPPSVVQILARNYRGKKPISRVVDLGCGAGLGTFIWEGEAEEVIGVDPSPAMLQVARAI